MSLESQIRELVFTQVEPIEIPVTIGTEKYVLREAGERNSIKFRNSLSRAMRAGHGMADTEPELISYCLYKVVMKGDRRTLSQVSKDYILDNIRTDICKELFKTAVRISGLMPRTDPANVQKTVLELVEILTSAADVRSIIKELEAKAEDMEAEVAAGREEDPSKNSQGSTGGFFATPNDMESLLARPSGSGDDGQS